MNGNFSNTGKGGRGNALFLILIAVALFAALSYAITQSSRGGGNIDKEKAKLDAAVAQDCTARVEQAVMRLEITGGCSEGQISYEYNGNNVNADAPADKHCHVFDPAGAGETACGTYLLASSEEGCDESAAAPGEVVSGGNCDGLVYVSDNLGSRLYTTIADQGYLGWDDANSSCTSLGAGWHLPDTDELGELRAAKHTGALNGTFQEGFSPIGIYWSSVTCSDGGIALDYYFFDEEPPACAPDQSLFVRCVR